MPCARSRGSSVGQEAWPNDAGVNLQANYFPPICRESSVDKLSRSVGADVGCTVSYCGYSEFVGVCLACFVSVSEARRLWSQIQGSLRRADSVLSPSSRAWRKRRFHFPTYTDSESPSIVGILRAGPTVLTTILARTKPNPAGSDLRAALDLAWNSVRGILWMPKRLVGTFDWHSPGQGRASLS